MEFSKHMGLLGICERYNESPYARVNTGPDVAQLYRKDLIGLKEIHLVNILPFSGDELFFVLVIDVEFFSKNMSGLSEGEVIINDPDGHAIGKFNISGSSKGSKDAQVPQKFILSAGKLAGIIAKPGEYQLVRTVSGSRELVGKFYIHYQPALPLTPERIQAIKSDPLAAKQLLFEILCNKCNSRYKIACALERKIMAGEEAGIWYEDLPDEFKCECGEVRTNLKYLRESMHSLLGYKQSKYSSNTEIIERAYTLR
ncbi:MAG TPA: hypothetical protein VN495_02535, partial [Candidatus Paceibacterota bacterium]|nr:hypothetical protein [Candidatus Paceibacterota bacterium]